MAHINPVWPNDGDPGWGDTLNANFNTMTAQLNSHDDQIAAIGSGVATPSATTTSQGVIQLAGDLSGTASAPVLQGIITAGTVGSTSTIPVITFDGKGRITAATSVAAPTGGGSSSPWIMLSGSGIDPTGTSDSYSAVQAILTAAPSGSTVVVPDGANIRINGQLSLPNAIRLGGAGVLNFYGLTGSGHSAGITVLADHTILDRLNIGNPSMAIGAPTQGNGVSQYGILIKANDTLVTNCWVDKFQSGIVVDTHGEYERTRIIGNTVSDVLGAGGGPSGVLADGEDRGDGICNWGSQATIVGNIVSCRAGNDARIGIHTEALPDQETTVTAHADSMVTISGNIVFGQFRRGIVSEEVKRVSIVGNSIADPTWWGVALIAAQDCIIANNTIHYTRTASDNQGSYWGPRHSGIMIWSSSAAVLNPVIQGNTIHVATGATISVGIAFDGGTTYIPAHINPVVEGNVIRDESGTMTAGIQFIRASLGAKVMNNLVPIFQQYGVIVQSGTEISISGNKLTGPGTAVTGSKGIHFNGSTSDWQLNNNAIADVDTGINCVNGVDVQVNSNTFTRCNTGINGFGTAAPFVIVGNLFSSSVTTVRQSVTGNAVQAGNSN